MAIHRIDAVGFRCPQPVLKVAAKSPFLAPGDVLEVAGDCPTFEQDIRKWCTRMRKTILKVLHNDRVTEVQILI